MEYIIETEFQGPGFVAVPNHVARMGGISPEALGVLVFLASQPRGFLARWSVIAEHFSMGKDRWQRIARELRAVGAMRLHTVRGVGGRVIGRRMSVRWPEPGQATETESRETRLSVRNPEQPKAGKSAKVSREIRQSERENPAPYKDERKTQGARAKPSKPENRQPGRGHAALAERLTAFQRAALREGRPVLVGTDLVHPGSQRHAELARSVRLRDENEAHARWLASADAMKGGAA